MKKTIIALTLLLGAPLFAESYTYGSTSINMVLPGFGLGYRSYPSKHGFDISARAEGINEGFWGYKGRALYLYRLNSGVYCGVGGGTGCWYYEGERSILPSADAVIGYEWKKSFLQLETASIVSRKVESLYIPVPAITFGFHF